MRKFMVLMVVVAIVAWNFTPSSASAGTGQPGDGSIVLAQADEGSKEAGSEVAVKDEGSAAAEPAKEEKKEEKKEEASKETAAKDEKKPEVKADKKEAAKEETKDEKKETQAKAAGDAPDKITFENVGKMGPVEFPHKLHGEKNECKACHEGDKPLFEKKVTKTGWKMADMYAGKTCGFCHDGKEKHPFEAKKSCAKCHKKK